MGGSKGGGESTGGWVRGEGPQTGGSWGKVCKWVGQGRICKLSKGKSCGSQLPSVYLSCSCNFDGAPCNLSLFESEMTDFGLCYTFNGNRTVKLTTRKTGENKPPPPNPLPGKKGPRQKLICGVCVSCVGEAKTWYLLLSWFFVTFFSAACCLWPTPCCSEIFFKQTMLCVWILVLCSQTGPVLCYFQPGLRFISDSERQRLVSVFCPFSCALLQFHVPVFCKFGVQIQPGQIQYSYPKLSVQLVLCSVQVLSGVCRCC